MAAARLSAGVPLLDEALGGGLPFGAVCEWGLPIGRGGRRVVLEFVARATQGSAGAWCLWVRPVQADLQIYPPAWSAAGAELERLRFAFCRKAVEELKPLITDPFFKILVLDAPEGLTRDDLAYLARTARKQQRLVLVLRDYALTAERGNVWAKLRVNCWRTDFHDPLYALETIRGLPPRRLAFTLPAEA